MPMLLTPKPPHYGFRWYTLWLMKEYILGILGLLTVLFLALFIGAATIWDVEGHFGLVPLLLFLCSAPVFGFALWLGLKGYQFAKTDQVEKDAARAEREGRGGPLI